jgi:hypothetical protein
MNMRIGVVIGLAALLLGSSGCEEGPKKGLKTTGKTARKAARNLPGACECALECAKNANLDDPRGLDTCTGECGSEFGAKLAVEGFQRALEVMSKDRESCDD